jgi:hypothetical protein
MSCITLVITVNILYSTEILFIIYTLYALCESVQIPRCDAGPSISHALCCVGILSLYMHSLRMHGMAMVTIVHCTRTIARFPCVMHGRGNYHGLYRDSIFIHSDSLCHAWPCQVSCICCTIIQSPYMRP